MAILRVCVAAIAVAAVRAQTLADARDLEEAKKAFDSRRTLKPLPCDIRAVQPSPDYRLRLHAGYRIEVPLSQLRGSGHELQVYLRVVPDGHDAVYFTSATKLPDVPKTNAAGELKGDFVVGEGNYGVEVVVQSNSSGVCRNKWRIQAKRNGAIQEL